LGCRSFWEAETPLPPVQCDAALEALPQLPQPANPANILGLFLIGKDATCTNQLLQNSKSMVDAVYGMLGNTSGCKWTDDKAVKLWAMCPKYPPMHLCICVLLMGNRAVWQHTTLPFTVALIIFPTILWRAIPNKHWPPFGTCGVHGVCRSGTSRTPTNRQRPMRG
jgi:hypothetical protein